MMNSDEMNMYKVDVSLFGMPKSIVNYTKCVNAENPEDAIEFVKENAGRSGLQNIQISAVRQWSEEMQDWIAVEQKKELNDLQKDIVKRIIDGVGNDAKDILINIRDVAEYGLDILNLNPDVNGGNSYEDIDSVINEFEDGVSAFNEYLKDGSTHISPFSFSGRAQILSMLIAVEMHDIVSDYDNINGYPPYLVEYLESEGISIHENNDIGME